MRYLQLVNVCLPVTMLKSSICPEVQGNAKPEQPKLEVRRAESGNRVLRVGRAATPTGRGQPAPPHQLGSLGSASCKLPQCGPDRNPARAPDSFRAMLLLQMQCPWTTNLPWLAWRLPTTLHTCRFLETELSGPDSGLSPLARTEGSTELTTLLYVCRQDISKIRWRIMGHKQSE